MHELSLSLSVQFMAYSLWSVCAGVFFLEPAPESSLFVLSHCHCVHHVAFCGCAFSANLGITQTV